jgi:SAM-dependent methyltransferase
VNPKLNPNSIYTRQFFDSQQVGSVSSASLVVPEILSLFPKSKSVVDVGCGVGAWLAEFSKNGVSDIVGYDGGDIASDQLRIPANCFQTVDLTNFRPPGRRFDIAVSLEVAEHLPESAADGFVRTLVSLSDIIVFSAAIPGQMGTDHINEQPLSYWREKFSTHSYSFYDCIRPVIWKNERIEWWYRQNTVVAITDKLLDRTPRRIKDGDIIDIVHPTLLTDSRRRERRAVDKLRFGYRFKKWASRFKSKA